MTVENTCMGPCIGAFVNGEAMDGKQCLHKDATCAPWEYDLHFRKVCACSNELNGSIKGFAVTFSSPGKQPIRLGGRHCLLAAHPD